MIVVIVSKVDQHHILIRWDGSVGQDSGNDKLNLVDLALLPYTPIVGSGSAPLQPQVIWFELMLIRYRYIIFTLAFSIRSSLILLNFLLSRLILYIQLLKNIFVLPLYETLRKSMMLPSELHFLRFVILRPGHCRATSRYVKYKVISHQTLALI